MQAASLYTYPTMLMHFEHDMLSIFVPQFHDWRQPSPCQAANLQSCTGACLITVSRPNLVLTGASEILGLEAAGIVSEVGKGVTKFKQGDKVCALLDGGGYAEYAVAPEGFIMPMPKNLSFAEAAGIPEVTNPPCQPPTSPLPLPPVNNPRASTLSCCDVAVAQDSSPCVVLLALLQNEAPQAVIVP